MGIKEKIEMLLGGFLERNKNYSVNVYIRNGVTGNFMTRLLIPIERNIQLEEKKLLMGWKVSDVECNELSLMHDEIMDCYEEKDEYNQQMVHVLMKNGMMIEFECCGERQ